MEETVTVTSGTELGGSFLDTQGETIHKSGSFSQWENAHVLILEMNQTGSTTGQKEHPH